MTQWPQDNHGRTAMTTALARKRRQDINLPALHAECETNYLRLRKLLPDLVTQERRYLGLPGLAGHTSRRLQFSVLERARYTTTVEIAEFGQRPGWGLSASFTVRLYHDARMAEVLRFQREQHVALSCSYPNPRMFLPDEKQQWNFLLGEWLTHCLAHGYSLGLEAESWARSLDGYAPRDTGETGA